MPISNACISVVTDFLAALLPIFLFLQLQMPKRDKYGLGAIFGVGFMLVATTSLVISSCGHNSDLL